VACGSTGAVDGEIGSSCLGACSRRMAPELGGWTDGAGGAGGTCAKTTTLKHAAAAAKTLLIADIFSLGAFWILFQASPPQCEAPLPLARDASGKPNPGFLDNYVTFLLDSTCPNQA